MQRRRSSFQVIASCADVDILPRASDAIVESPTGLPPAVAARAGAMGIGIIALALAMLHRGQQLRGNAKQLSEAAVKRLLPLNRRSA